MTFKFNKPSHYEPEALDLGPAQRNRIAMNHSSRGKNKYDGMTTGECQVKNYSVVSSLNKNS